MSETGLAAWSANKHSSEGQQEDVLDGHDEGDWFAYRPEPCRDSAIVGCQRWTLYGT